MKTTHLSLIILFLIFSPILPNALAQDYTTWGLPDGAMARLGKGKITGNIAFTPDGNRLAVASSIGIWIYDVRPGKEKELDLLTGHTGEVTFITLSPDGKILASGGRDGTIRLWDVVTGENKKQLTGHKWAISSLAFSPDGQTLASAIGHEAEMIPPQIGIEIDIKLWNIETGEVAATFRGHGKDITSLAFSPDGKTLASSGKDSKVLLWNVATGRNAMLLTEHDENVFYIGFSPDGKTIATGSWDDTVKLWDATTSSLKNTIIEKGFVGVSSVAFSPKDSTIAVGGHDTIRLWDLQTKTHIRSFKGHGGNISSIAFSPDGNTFATVGDRFDNTIMLWDLRTAKHRTTIKEHTSAVRCLTYSPDGKTIASGMMNGDGYLWDAQTGERKATLKGHYDEMKFITYTSDGSTIITGGRNRSVHQWEGRKRLLQTRTRKPKSSLRLATTSGVSRIRSMTYSPDANFVAATGRDKWILMIWNARTGRKVNVHSDQSHRSWRVLFSPDGSILAEADNTLKIRLWDPQTWQITKTLKLHNRFKIGNTHMAFSADGKLLATNTREEDTVQIWDVASGKEVALMKMPGSGVTKVQFSPNGALIATGFRDGTLHIFSRHTEEHLGGYKGHTDGISVLTFSPDSRTIASGSDDGTILIWELQ